MNGEILPAAALGVFLALSLVAPPRVLLVLALLSAPFQIHSIEVMGIYPSLTLLVCLALWASAVMGPWGLIVSPPIRYYVLLLLVSALSVLWAVDTRLGLRTVLYLMPFLFLYITSYRAARRSTADLCRWMSWAAYLILIEAALVIAFRLSPSLERDFLQSDFAKFFISANELEGLFTFARNNVVDPGKSGGLFTNANVAGAFLGTTSFIAYGLARHTGRRTLFCIAAICWSAVFFTGSKAAILLALLLPVTALLATLVLIEALKTTRRKGLGAIAAGCLIGLTVLSVALGASAAAPVERLVPELTSGIDVTFNVRLQMWESAGEAFLQSPVLGQGFGGWEEALPGYGIRLRRQDTVFPPHNSVIHLWSQSGLAAALLGVMFIGSIVRLGVRGVRCRWLDSQVAVALVGAYAWVFIQGLGENYGLIGKLHLQPLLASALALLSVLPSRSPGSSCVA